MSQWLTRTHHDDPIWDENFRQPAAKYKRAKPFFHARSLRAVATKTPVRLAGDVLSELRRHHKGKPTGGGIAELLHWLSAEAAQVTGFNSFREWTGMGHDHRAIPKEAQTFAKAVDATYMNVHKRPNRVEGLTRLPEYDAPRYSVWQQPNGQYLVSIHGTKANWHDVRADVSIAAGGKAQDESVQAIFDRFDKEGIAYDVAAHSLSTQYVTNAQHKNADKLYMFNPASSPLMDSTYLTETANDPQYTNFINPSDAVSEALWQKMTDTTVSNSYVRPYTRSQAAAHSIGQWYDH